MEKSNYVKNVWEKDPDDWDVTDYWVAWCDLFGISRDPEHIARAIYLTKYLVTTMIIPYPGEELKKYNKKVVILAEAELSRIPQEKWDVLDWKIFWWTLGYSHEDIEKTAKEWFTCMKCENACKRRAVFCEECK